MSNRASVLLSGIALSLRLRAALVPALALMILGCGGGGSPTPAPNAPFIGAAVVGFTPRAAQAGLSAEASVVVADAATGAPLTGALVTVNGSTLGYVEMAGDYEGLVSIAAGSQVAVSVKVNGTTYRATRQLDAYPTVSAPSPGETWSALAPHPVTWQPGAPLAGATYAVGVVDAADPNGTLIWPTDQQFQQLPAAAGTFQLQPGTITAGERLLVVGLVALGPFPGASTDSGLLVAAFDAAPVTVKVGTPVASGPGPVNLLAAGGSLLWSDGEAPVKTVPTAGGPVTRLVERHAMPESVRVVGSSLYWIAGDQLLRSARDGSGTTVVAQGPRTPETTATAVDLIVDGADAYWVNTVPNSGCSPTCRWAVVRVPLNGGAPVTLATSQAVIRGLATDATNVYWVQEGVGPVSTDGNDPADSAVRAVPKAGGAAVTLVNGLLNGPAPVLPPGSIPGNWFSRGGLLVVGNRLVFSTTGFFDGYRILQVATTGGVVTELQKVTGANSGFARAMTSDGVNLYWIDDSTVKSVSLAGGVAVNLASGLYQPTGVAIAAGRVIWSETVCCTVRANGRVRSVAVGGGAALTLADLLDNPAGVTADADAAFWVEGGAYGATEGYGRIARAALQGGGAATVVAAVFTDRPPIASDGDRLVFADHWRVKAVPLAGGPLDNVLSASWTLAGVVSDGVHVYALDVNGTLLRAPVAGGGPTEVVVPGSQSFGAPGPLRIGGGYVYWVDPEAALHRMPLAGGAVETVATNLQGLSDMVVDGSFVYLARGSLQVVPVTGGTPSAIGSGESHPGARLALYGGRLYWIENNRLGRITLASGEDQVLAIGLMGDPSFANSIAVDAAGLYWIESGSGIIKRSDDR